MYYCGEKKALLLIERFSKGKKEVERSEAVLHKHGTWPVEFINNFTATLCGLCLCTASPQAVTQTKGVKRKFAFEACRVMSVDGGGQTFSGHKKRTTCLMNSGENSSFGSEPINQPRVSPSWSIGRPVNQSSRKTTAAPPRPPSSHSLPPSLSPSLSPPLLSSSSFVLKVIETCGQLDVFPFNNNFTKKKLLENG